VTLILDRLTRAKQVRPGQWMAACPCCESRRGRPLAVTETGDGRILLYAFCGCSTEDVLGRLGLQLADLFDQPMGSVAPTPSRVPARDVLASLSEEASVVAVIASDVLDGRVIEDATWQRLQQAVHRIGNARDYIYESGK
jgi:hypothetical protein